MYKSGQHGPERYAGSRKSDPASEVRTAKADEAMETWKKHEASEEQADSLGKFLRKQAGRCEGTVSSAQAR